MIPKNFVAKVCSGWGRFVLGSLLAVVFAAPVAADEVAVPSDYRLGSGDKISIVVFGEAELSLQVALNEAGRFNYPFLGEIVAVGKTAADVETALMTGLKGDYLLNPRVSVTIVEYRPFFISGQIARPGSYPYSPGMTVRKALTLAGGITDRGSERRIMLIAESDKARKSEGRKVGLDDRIGPGDVITIGESFF
jgi:protein involved in polysaccharide export with SLBB domain